MRCGSFFSRPWGRRRRCRALFRKRRRERRLEWGRNRRHSTCRSLLDIYSFVRFLFILEVWRPALFVPTPWNWQLFQPTSTLSSPNTVPLNDVTTARLDPRNPFTPLHPSLLCSLSRPSERRKKINGRIRMNFINWIARRASRFDATRTSFVNAGVTCCNRLFKSSLRLLKKRQTCCRLPFARYHPWLRTVIAADGHGEKVIAVNMEILLAHTVFLRAWGHVIEVSYI